MSLEILFVIVFGLSIGSFANVLIHRVPRGKSIVFPASHCPKCGVKLKIWHNIPLLSWLFLHGRCAFCNSKISARYPIVEVISAVIFVIIYFKLGFNFEAMIVAFTFVTLLSLSLIDIEYKAVPDSLNLTALTLAIAYPLDWHLIALNLENALLFAGAFAFLRFYVSFFAGREAMGEGDIMIAGTMGAILGVYTGVFAIFLSSILTIPAILIFKEREMPFIPFLSLALFLVYIFEREAISFLNMVLY